MSKNVKEIEGLIKTLGLTECAKISRVSKSLCIQLVGPSGTRKVFAPCTPSDHRNTMNLRRDMRRIAGEIGLTCA